MASSRDWSRRLAWGGFALAAAWIGVALAAWGVLANGLRFGSPWYAVDGQTLLFSHAVQVEGVLGAALLILAAAVMGYAWVVRPVFGGRRLADGPWMLFAGAVPGILIAVAVSRIVTLLLPNSVAPPVVGTIILAATGLAIWMVWRDRGFGEPDWRTGLWPALAAAAAVLVFSVQIDRMHVMGSASHDFVRDLFLNGPHAIGAAGHFPLISQHYDEPAFLYPVVYGLMARDASADGTLTVILWLLNGVGRLSMLSLIYLSVRLLGLDRLSAFAATAFVWAASLAVNPVASTLLFDSLSPLGAVLHIGRTLAPAAPLLFVAISAGLTRRPTAPGLLVAALAGAGLSAMSVQMALVLVWGAAVMLLTAAAPRGAGSQGLWRAACAASLIVLLAFSFAYGLQAAPDLVRAGVLVASAPLAGLALLWALWRVWRREEDPDRLDLGPRRWMTAIRARRPLAALRGLDPSAPFWLAFGAGYLAGFVFLGNVLVRAWQFRLSLFWPWGDIQIWDRYYGTLATKGIALMQSPFCAAGESWAYRLIANHCGSLPMFVRTYGLPFVLTAAVCAWLLRRASQGRPLASDRVTTMAMWGMLLCLLAQPLGFLVLDFMVGEGAEAHWALFLSTWLRARLLEPWFYGGVLFPLVFFLRDAADRPRRWAQSAMLAAVAVFALSPFELPAQLVANSLYLVTRAAGL